MSERVNFDRLIVAGDHQARAAMRLEIANHGGNQPAGRSPAGWRPATSR